MLNLWCDLHNYIKLTSFLPMLVLAIPTCIPFFRNGFFTCSCRFFFIDTSYEVSAWTESQEGDETTLQVYKYGSLKSYRLKRRVGTMYYLGH